MRSTSPRLLEPTAAMENGKYKPPESCLWTYNEKIIRPVPQRLLTSTAAVELAKYHKPEVDVDPREIGWKKPYPKPPNLIKVEPQDADSGISALTFV